MVVQVLSLSATLLQRFTAIHRADLAANVTIYAEATRERLATITSALIARGGVVRHVYSSQLRVTRHSREALDTISAINAPPPSQP